MKDPTHNAQPRRDAPDLPFVADSRGEDLVVSSLDSRRELRGTVDDLLARFRAHEDSLARQEAQERALPTAALLVQVPEGTIETTHIIDGLRCLIGRENCDLELQDRFVERWHAQLFRRDATLLLQDLESTNGVYLRIADDLALEDGDQIALGEQRFEFRTTWDTPQRGNTRGDVEAAGAPWTGPPARLIRYVEGNQIGGVYPLGRQLVIGSQQGDICLPEDPRLSSTHALIHIDADRYVLRDLDSDFGTFIRIADAVELIDGDCFLVGRTKIRLTFP